MCKRSPRARSRLLGWAEPSPRDAGASGTGHLLLSALGILCKPLGESFSVFEVKVVTPALPPSSDYSVAQVGKPREEPELWIKLDVGSRPRSAGYQLLTLSQTEPSSVKSR